MKEINDLIAEKVMGWELAVTEGTEWIPSTSYWITDIGCNYGVEEWNPTSSIDHAWMVVEGLNFDVKVTKYKDMNPKYQAHVFIPGNVQMVFADTSPMAICLAALKAVGVEVNTR